MQLSVLIVDDESLMRKGIQMAIDWISYGIHQVSTAPNGRVALEMMEEQQPDLLLTDVRMPGIDGLELSRIVKERWSSIKVIIISGYDDFAYAKKSISYGVSDYILKPIDVKTLGQTVEKSVKEITEERTKLNEHSYMSQKLVQTMGIARQKVLKDVLFGEVERLELQRYGNLLGLNDALNGGAAVALVKIHSFKEKSSVFRDGGLLHFAVQNILEELLRKHGIGELVDVRLGSLCLLLKPGDSDTLDRFVSQAQQAVSETIRVQTAWGLSRIYEGGVGEMRRSYHQAAGVLKLRWLFPDSRIFKSGSILKLLVFPQPAADTYKALSHALLLGNVDVMQAQLDLAYYQLLRSGDKYTPDSIEAYFVEMARVVDSVQKEQGGKKLEFVEQVVDTLYFSDTLQDVVDSMKEMFQKACQAVQNNFRRPYTKIIRDVIDYLNDNFKNEISLANAANHVFLNRSYLSHLFVQETGSNFSDFLTELRIEKAKDLLHTTTMKNYEVAEAVAYKDFRHFGQIFKKHTGMTPSEYRKLAP